jgi:hypothetical protein
LLVPSKKLGKRVLGAEIAQLHGLSKDTGESGGLAEAQAQVVLQLTSNALCSNDFRTDACGYERYLGQTARFLKKKYSHILQMFLQSRIYPGYAAAGSLNPNPLPMSTGLPPSGLATPRLQRFVAASWNPVAGDLRLDVAPWIGRGPHFWGSGNTPRQDGLTWIPSDYGSDLIHPAANGANKVAQLMLQFYLNSPYSPWFRQ